MEGMEYASMVGMLLCLTAMFNGMSNLTMADRGFFIFGYLIFYLNMKRGS